MYLQQIIDNTLIETPDSEDFFLRITASHLLIDENRLTIAPDSAVVTIIDDGTSMLCVLTYTEILYAHAAQLVSHIIIILILIT